MGGAPEIVLGKATGMAKLGWKPKQLGITLEEDKKKKLLAYIKDKAMGKKGLVTDQEVKNLLEKV